MSPLLLMLLSTVCLSLSGFLAKYLEHIVPINVLLMARLTIPAIIMLGTAFILRARLPTFAETKVIGKRSIFIALTQFCFFLSLSKLSLIELVVLFSTGPLFIPIIERILYGSTISRPIVLTLVFSFFGVIVQSGVINGVQFQWGMLLGLLAGFFNACSQVSMYKSSQIKLNPFMTNGVSFLIAVILVLPIATLLMESSTSEFTYWLFPYAEVIVLMGALSVGTQLFRTKAYQRSLSSAELAPIFYLNIFIAALLQAIFFEQTFQLFQVVGLAIIVSACLAYSYASYNSR
ncbi:DMT family transporter [Vibrio sp. 2-Bac 85]